MGAKINHFADNTKRKLYFLSFLLIGMLTLAKDCLPLQKKMAIS